MFTVNDYAFMVVEIALWQGVFVAGLILAIASYQIRSGAFIAWLLICIIGLCGAFVNYTTSNTLPQLLPEQMQKVVVFGLLGTITVAGIIFGIAAFTYGYLARTKDKTSTTT